MKYLKLFENKKYSRNLYWEHQFKEIIDEEWTELSTSRGGDANIIKFQTGKGYDKGYEYSVIFEIKYGKDDDIYLEESVIPKFIEKFKKEFMKHPEIYVQNFKKDPKFLGNLDIYRESEKYNL